MVGANKVASEVGLGAGASVAAAFWVANAAINTIITAKKSPILNDSIVDFSLEVFCKLQRMWWRKGKKENVTKTWYGV